MDEILSRGIEKCSVPQDEDLFLSFNNVEFTVGDSFIDLGAIYDTVTTISSTYVFANALLSSNAVYVDINGLETEYDEYLDLGLENTLENFLLFFLLDPAILSPAMTVTSSSRIRS